MSAATLNNPISRDDAATVSALLQHFPDAVQLRRVGDDVCYADREIAPHCGFLSLRESAILLGVVRKHPGTWLEIGSHVGWSAAVIAAGGSPVIMVDPEFSEQAKSGVRSRAMDNLCHGGAIYWTTQFGQTSAEFFDSPRCHGDFAGVLIDGDHDSPQPMNDAKNAAKYLNPGGVIVLHDALGQPVKDGVEYLRWLGFRVEMHATMNGLAVCEAPNRTAA
jgi:hypothetical protein